MPTLSTINSVITEYGLPWAVCRALYGAKLKLLRALPASEALFEKRAEIKRTDIIKTDIAAIEAFLGHISDGERHRITDAADNAVRGRLKAFSSLDLDYGDPIDWQLNPLTGKRCPADARWYRIPDFDSERGDIKLVWEASRFTHFYLFARAYMLTCDRKYYEAFSAQLDGWLAANPYPDGANYKCGQECALRMINALTVYSVFRGYGLTDRRDEENIAELTGRCYRKILSNFFYAHRCIKNNHTLSELCGMIIGAWCCGDTRTLGKAYRLLDREIAAQFTADGGYRQFSFNYQRLALQICSRVISLSGATGKALCGRSLERIKQSARMLYCCQSENGDLPNYGSNDGALIFPLSCCDYRDYRPSVSASHILSGGGRLYEAGVWDEEALWLGALTDTAGAPAETASALTDAASAPADTASALTGKSSALTDAASALTDAASAPADTAEAQRKSHSFPDAGIYTLRTADSMAMAVLNRYRSRPAHMDQLHFDLWHRGINVFCDCGTYSYASPLGAGLVLTGGHNTVKVNGTEQMRRVGSFMICGWSRASDITVTDSVFEGKMTSQNRYSHRRRIEFIYAGSTPDKVSVPDTGNTPDKVTVPDTVIITDTVSIPGTGYAGLPCEILYHTPLRATRIGEREFALSDGGSPVCTLEARGCRVYVTEGHRSLYYMRDEAISVIHIAPTSAELCTVSTIIRFTDTDRRA